MIESLDTSAYHQPCLVRRLGLRVLVRFARLTAHQRGGLATPTASPLLTTYGRRYRETRQVERQRQYSCISSPARRKTTTAGIKLGTKQLDIRRQVSGMSTEAISVVIGTVFTVAGSVAGLVWWAYRRGQAAGAQRAEDTARIEALERQLIETRRELAALESRRGRS